MSHMCKMNEACSTSKGMCGHEKMMMFFVMVGGIAGLAHWAFHWF